MRVKDSNPQINNSNMIWKPISKVLDMPQNNNNNKRFGNNWNYEIELDLSMTSKA